uniref:Uncharacterized protein n=1 Tax=Schistocephalus solidus TaxID=70667 RepID=A0A0X3P575_SCHSO
MGIHWRSFGRHYCLISSYPHSPNYKTSIRTLLQEVDRCVPLHRSPFIFPTASLRGALLGNLYLLKSSSEREQLGRDLSPLNYHIHRLVCVPLTDREHVQPGHRLK